MSRPASPQSPTNPAFAVASASVVTDLDFYQYRDTIKTKLEAFLTRAQNPGDADRVLDLREIGIFWLRLLCGTGTAVDIETDIFWLRLLCGTGTVDIETDIFYQFSKIPPNIVHLIWQCLDPDPSQWIAIAEKLLEDPYFNNQDGLKSPFFLAQKLHAAGDLEEYGELVRKRCDEIAALHKTITLYEIGQALRVHRELQPPENSGLAALQTNVNKIRIALAQLVLEYDRLYRPSNKDLPEHWFTRIIPVLIGLLKLHGNRYANFFDLRNDASGGKLVTQVNDSCWVSAVAHSVCANLDWERQHSLLKEGVPPIPMLPPLLFSSLYNALLHWRRCNDHDLKKTNLAPPGSKYLLSLQILYKAPRLLESFSDCILAVLKDFDFFGVAAITPIPLVGYDLCLMPSSGDLTPERGKLYIGLTQVNQDKCLTYSVIDIAFMKRKDGILTEYDGPIPETLNDDTLNQLDRAKILKILSAQEYIHHPAIKPPPKTKDLTGEMQGLLRNGYPLCFSFENTMAGNDTPFSVEDIAQHKLKLEEQLCEAETKGDQPEITRIKQEIEASISSSTWHMMVTKGMHSNTVVPAEGIAPGAARVTDVLAATSSRTPAEDLAAGTGSGDSSAGTTDSNKGAIVLLDSQFYDKPYSTFLGEQASGGGDDNDPLCVPVDPIQLVLPEGLMYSLYVDCIEVLVTLEQKPILHPRPEHLHSFFSDYQRHKNNLRRIEARALAIATSKLLQEAIRLLVRAGKEKYLIPIQELQNELGAIETASNTGTINDLHTMKTQQKQAIWVISGICAISNVSDDVKTALTKLQEQQAPQPATTSSAVAAAPPTDGKEILDDRACDLTLGPAAY